MRQLVIVAELAGLTEAHTTGAFVALERRLATSARLVVPGPWAPEVVRRYRGQDFGVALTLTSPHPVLRLSPLTLAPTLRSGDGGFPATAADLVEHADAEEAALELRTQLERAILWGISVSHVALLDEGVLARADLFDAVVSLAEEYDLVVRLTPGADEARLGYDAWRLARERSVRTIDALVPLDPSELKEPRDLLAALTQAAHALPDGVSELGLPLASASPELSAWVASGGRRAAPTTLVHHADKLWHELAHRHVVATSYRELSRRAGRSPSAERAPLPASDTRSRP